MQQPRAVFRVPLGRTLTVVTVALMASALGGLILSGDITILVQSTPLLALVSMGAWLVFWRPRVIVENEGVQIVNVARTWNIPFAALSDMEVRYGLTLNTTAGRVNAWAATAPGRHEALRLSRADFAQPTRNVQAGHVARPAEALTTESGAAAHVISLRWQTWLSREKESGPSNDAHTVSRTWHAASLGVMAGIVVVAGVTLATL